MTALLYLCCYLYLYITYPPIICLFYFLLFFFNELDVEGFIICKLMEQRLRFTDFIISGS